MTARVHVAMAVTDANEAEVLRRAAADDGAELAFLQRGDPSLVSVLDRLGAEDAVVLEPVTLASRPPARSWVRRVAAHWVREHPHAARVLVGDSPVTGREAPLSSAAWDDVPAHRHHVLVCRGPRCSAQGGDATAETIGSALDDAGLGDDDVLVTQTGCLFPCNHAPVVVVHPADAWFGAVDAAVARRLVTDVLVENGDLPDHRLERTPREPRPPEQ